MGNDLHGLVLAWRDCARWHLHEQIKHTHVPFLPEHRFHFLPPVHDVRLIFPDQQVFSGLDNVRGICNLPRTPLAYESLRGSSGHDLMPVVLDVLSPWSFEPFPVLGPLRLFGGYFGKHAPWHHVLATPESTTTVTFFHVYRSPSAFRETK